MGNREPSDDGEYLARRAIVTLAQEMLVGRLSYFEGAPRICSLRSQIHGIAERDPDFDAFTLIASETDHLPLEAQRHLWSPAAIDRLRPDFVRTEKWASEFAPGACRNLITRFGS